MPVVQAGDCFIAADSSS